MNDHQRQLALATGQSEELLVSWKNAVQVHQQLVEPLTELVSLAADKGIQLQVASGYRSFDRQLAIWNGKVCGERPVLDEQGELIPPGSLDDESLMWALLRWSALPGTSRHHWGSDLDVWDSAAVDAGYQLQLTPDEYGQKGPFVRLNDFLLKHASNSVDGFFRPYARTSSKGAGGVMPEPWHISYAPVADNYARCLTVEAMAGLVEGADICLKPVILHHLEEIMERFVTIDRDMTSPRD